MTLKSPLAPGLNPMRLSATSLAAVAHRSAVVLLGLTQMPRMVHA